MSRLPQKNETLHQTSDGRPFKRVCKEDKDVTTIQLVVPKVVDPSGLSHSQPSETSQSTPHVQRFIPCETTPHSDDAPIAAEEIRQSTAESLSSRPVRTRRLPARFRDLLPEPPPPVPVQPPPTEPATLPRIILYVFDSFRTAFNTFGIAREYRHRPTYDPDHTLSLEELSHRYPETVDDDAIQPFEAPPLPVPPSPWKSMAHWHFMRWLLSGSSQKSASEANRLTSTVFTAKGFSLDAFSGFNAYAELKRLDELGNALDTSPESPHHKDGWKESTISISVPTREQNPAGNGQDFEIPGFLHRNLTSVVRMAFSGLLSEKFHFVPFKRIWKSPSTGGEQRVYDELYTSDTWIKAHDELQKQRHNDGGTQEWVIAGIMFSSDSTHLAQFGHASAWPIYMSFGNLSKYVRAQPNTPGASHLVGFIPKLPNHLDHFISHVTKRKTTSDILTHCKRELVQAVWKILLDKEFRDAYKNGIEVKCHDGVTRRVFPRIFTYSADYPEKVLLATIRDKGICPCHRCLVPKNDFSHLGLLSDIAARTSKIRQYFWDQISAARDAIYKLGAPIKGSRPEHYLKAFSLVPTFNVFFDLLGSLGCNIFQILAVDLMHEFELGVFKSVLSHLLRLLYAINREAIGELNQRFRQTPPFGPHSIRRFPLDVSEMRQRPAWHFENVLQCAMPAFEGLFPCEHDEIVQMLLFRLAQWHALAKFRMHTEQSLTLLEHATRLLGQQLRKFKDFTCSSFQTMELPSEAAARWRRRQAESNTQTSELTPTISRTRASSAVQPKTFNLSTYKIHALGHYVASIKAMGTTDSYSTQIGELAHQQLKKFYRKTNKQEPMRQIATQERRLRALHNIDHRGNCLGTVDSEDHDNVSANSKLSQRYQMARGTRYTINLAQFLSDHSEDPAVYDFVPKLKSHLLSRLRNLNYDGDEMDFTAAERDSIYFVNGFNRIPMPRRLQINFTTYDVRRAYDSIHPGHGTVMLYSCEDGSNAHPFWYAQVLAAFVFRVCYDGIEHTEDVLWVRWLGVVPGYRWSIQKARPPKIGFVPHSPGAFGFIDPALVIRACHLIPVFAEGRTDSLLRRGHSIGRIGDNIDDWAAYYVNIFADRDMYARFARIGVGHDIQIPTWSAQPSDEPAVDVGTEDEDERITDDNDLSSNPPPARGWEATSVEGEPEDDNNDEDLSDDDSDSSVDEDEDEDTENYLSDSDDMMYHLSL